MPKSIKEIIFKILPLIVLYILFIVMFLANSDYEYIITLTAAIPFVVYIFNKDPKIELILRRVLYAFVAGLVVYIISRCIMDYNWFLFCQRNYYAESAWGIFKWNKFFIYDLKYLIYIGIIFLAVRSKK
ncbi:MAG: hypothetical protein WCK10_01730 [Candidatus Staskawiczbacteria bacterium]